MLILRVEEYALLFENSITTSTKSNRAKKYAVLVRTKSQHQLLPEPEEGIMIKIEVVEAVILMPKRSLMDILGIRRAVVSLTIAVQWVMWHLSVTGREFRSAKVSVIYTFKNQFLNVSLRGRHSLYVRVLPVDHNDAPVWDGFGSVVTLGDILHFLVHQQDRRGHYIFKIVTRTGKVAIVAAHARRGRWVLEALPEHFPYFWMVQYRIVTR